MERRLGADFSFVRIHTDGEANQMNKLLNARAFTYGNHIYFDKGKYSPETYEGKRLLAHELAHVIQQSGSIRTNLIQRSVESDQPITAPDIDLCSGWERDNESITIAAAKHFFKTEFDKDIIVEKVECEVTTTLIFCTLTLSDGTVVNVHFNPSRNIIRVQFKDASGKLRFCRYSYTCSSDGSIVFTKLSCG
jgi:hypothetical protein